ncbi:NAD binding domain of 6-phosphogluconate dehydrogenase-domain-containing protein [Scleroderma yunnanense]
MKPTISAFQALGRRTTHAQTTAFIGLGRMGAEMAYNLFSKKLADKPDSSFVVCDAVPESAVAFRSRFLSQFSGANIEVVQTPEEAALAASTIVTMLPSSPEVKAVYTESGGIMSALRSFTASEREQLLYIDSTTLDADVARQVASGVTQLGAQIIDAPVSGGVTGAKAGTLSFLVGGTNGAFQKAQPILTLMGKRVIHCGSSGAGLGAKICNNLVLGVQQIVVAEAMLLGQKLGLDPAVLAGVINCSTGACWASSVNNPVPSSLPDQSPPSERDFEGGFATCLMLKDIRLATDIANRHNSPLPLGEAARNLYAEVIDKHPDLTKKDFSSVYRYLERLGELPESGLDIFPLSALSDMTASVQKPTAIVFGGLNTCSRALAAFLVPPEGEALVSHLRIVDKFSVSPPTTYLGAEFPKVLDRAEVEYRQVNVTVLSAVASAFEPPAGKAPYDYVFDLTGEVNQDRGEVIAIKTTFTAARNISLEAAKRNVKAYVRLQQPVYDTSDKGSVDEKEDVKPVRAVDIWWHETLRMLASTENLNLVILRIGFVYGPYVEFGLYALVTTVASVYGYMKKPMKTMSGHRFRIMFPSANVGYSWGPGKDPVHTVHAEDVAGAMWACAQWMTPLGRKQADALAGEKIYFHNDSGKVKEVTGTCSSDAQPVAPIFNLVDDSATTLAKGGSMITEFFGTTFEFYSSVETTLAKLKLDDLGEEINEHHVGTWTEMLQLSAVPVTQTPLTAYMDKYALSRHRLGYSNDKIKHVVGYRLKRPQFCHETLKEVVDKWKAEGSWPVFHSN